MRRILFALLCASSAVCHAQQQPDFELMIQGGKDMVKLLWVPNAWPEGVTGFNVKRRTPGGEWQKLNSDTIILSNFEADFPTRTSDPDIIEQMKVKRAEMIAEGNIKAKGLEEHMADMRDPMMVKFTKFVVAQSYIGALVQGFAFVDSQVPAADSLEYGLFTVKWSDESAAPVATQTWKPGTMPALELKFGPGEVSGYQMRSGLAVRWPVDKAEVRAKAVRDFRIMKRDAQGVVSELGRTSINFAEENPSVGWFDFDYPHDQPASFFVIPVDVFDFSGTPSAEVAYSREKYPEG